MDQLKAILPGHLSTPPARLRWWNDLTHDWQIAFCESALGVAPDTVTDKQLLKLCESPAIRIVGAGGPNPNTSVQLRDLQGIAALTNLHVVIVTFVNLSSLAGIENLKELRSLFIHNNSIHSLGLISELNKLTELYCHDNQIETLKHLRHLRTLKTLTCAYNPLTSLAGLDPALAGTIETIACLPNPNLRSEEINNTERALRIRLSKM